MMVKKKSFGYLFLTTFFVLLTGCNQGELSVLDPKGPVAREQLFLINLSSGIMFFVLAVVSIIFIYVVIRYRERPGDQGLPKQNDGSTWLEVVWTVIPIILLIILAVPTVKMTISQGKMPEKGTALEVDVTAYQYWWEFKYPEYGFVTGQEMHIPVGKKVHLKMTSKDVIHALWVPELAGKMDTNPGKITEMVIQADKPGTYKGKCTELCGASHALMDFKVIAHEQDDFDKWVAKMKNPDSRAKNDIEKRGAEVLAQNCLGCHALEGGGFATKGDTAPDLTNYGLRTQIAGILDNNRENMARWLKNPQKLKPGNRMPSFEHLSDQDIAYLSEYLLNLK